MGAISPLLEPVVADVRNRRPIRTGSLIITVFGDIVAPRSQEVWLGSIGRLLEPFDVSYGQVRTAASRLRAEDWLSRQPHGRRSFVALTDQGRRRLDEATRRIYGPSEPWSGRWTILLFPGGLPPRSAIRNALGWIGFGTLSPQVFLHPHPDRRALESVLDDARAQLPPEASPIEIDGTNSLYSATLVQSGHPALDRLVATCWSFDQLQASYGRLLQRFEPLAKVLATDAEVLPEQAVTLRVALIHDYRRVLLRDPGLPPALLPARWVGAEARALVASIYDAIIEPAEAWLDEYLEGPDGPLPRSAELPKIHLGVEVRDQG
ncbi:MAG: hypothetical protein KTR31_29505 [Myxococcales bacterium]|nr:hypothetical protein [Myxococcales bacterium]